jgi:regulator of RNase E activity RraA
MLADDVLAALRRLDTPTVCNALEGVVPQRQGYGYTTRPLFCAHPALPPIVGYARTATISAAHPAGRDAEAEQKLRLAYYRHIAEGPHPTVTVIEDLDPSPGYGAWWGEVHTHVHRGLGSLGVITNGSVRDLDQVAEGFQMLAGSVGPSHAFVHAVECGQTVTVAGMTVRPGDLVHADRHGAVVIPLDVAERVPAAAEAVQRGESVLINASKQPGFGIEVLERMLGRGGGEH